MHSGGLWVPFFCACLVVAASAFGIMAGAMGPFTTAHFALLVACPGVLALCVALVALDKHDEGPQPPAAAPLLRV
jgi:peptidoglycan/LPS O-acetylase OafA/YrhL